MQLNKSEILIIVAIIAASYIFSMDEVKFLDTQLMFILITLGIVIIYKLMYIQKIKNLNNYNKQNNIVEKFVEMNLGGFNDFIGQNQTGKTNSISKDEFKKLEDKLNKLQEEIGNMYQRSGALENTNSITQLIHDSKTIDRKIEERTEEIEELKAMLVNKENEDRPDYTKVKYYDSATVNSANNNLEAFTSTNSIKTSMKPNIKPSNSINIKSSFKNMVSDADGGITEFRNTSPKILPNHKITKSHMQNTGGNSANQQNKSQISQLVNHIKKNGINITI